MNISCRKRHVILNISFLTLYYEYKETKDFQHFLKMEPYSYFLAEMCNVGGWSTSYERVCLQSKMRFVCIW